MYTEIAPSLKLQEVGRTLLDETSSTDDLRGALDAFANMCAEISGVKPDPDFDAWAEDSFLNDGVAISPQAAAHCARDYQRSATFIRGVWAAIRSLQLRFPDTVLDILYAGCGPFATLLLPLLGRFSPGELSITLLDFHLRSLDSVEVLLEHFGLDAHNARTIRADACNYVHPGQPHLVIAETMQKSLEQEPQFAVTANLAPQLRSQGIFIPQRIDVELCLADLQHEKSLLGQSQQLDGDTIAKRSGRYPIADVYSLSPENVSSQLQTARYNPRSKARELELATVTVPPLPDLDRFAPVLFTRIQVFEAYRLGDYECQLTLPSPCPGLQPLRSGQRYRICYELGAYPRCRFERLGDYQ